MENEKDVRLHEASMADTVSEAEVAEAEAASTSAAPRFSQAKLEAYMEKLKMEQNLIGGLVGGVIACLICAALWALITVTTEYQIGFMAVGVGLAVGMAIRIMGKGIDKVFGIAGAVLALVSCLLGNLLAIVSFAAAEYGMSMFEVLNHLDAATIADVMGASFSPIDLLFYGIAVYEGYKLSFRRITEEEIQQHAMV